MTTPPIGTLQTSPVVPGDMRTAPQAPEPHAPLQTPAHMGPSAVIRQDASIAAIGTLIADQAINSRDWQRLSTYTADANSDTEHTSFVGLNTLFGIGLRFADVLAAGQANGAFTVTGGVPSRTDLIYAFAVGRGRFVPLFEATVAAMRKVCAAVPGLRVSDPTPGEETAPEPQKIEIVGLPERITTSTVRYDSNGDISGTTMVETDS